MDNDKEAPVFILETHRRSDIGKLEGLLGETLRDGFRLAPLFPNAADEFFNGEDFNLGCFWELEHPGAPFHAWETSPYDFADDLAERANLRSVEPDIPTGLY